MISVPSASACGATANKQNGWDSVSHGGSECVPDSCASAASKEGVDGAGRHTWAAAMEGHPLWTSEPSGVEVAGG